MWVWLRVWLPVLPVNLLTTGFFSVEVTLSLNIPYFHFRWLLKLLTSHKCHCSLPVHIRDSSHTHCLTSLQESRLLANGRPYRPRKEFLCQKWGGQKTVFQDLRADRQPEFTRVMNHCWSLASANYFLSPLVQMAHPVPTKTFYS